MSDIAGAVGITKGSLYSHFAGKEELFFAVYDELAHDYEKLNSRLFEESKGMDIHDRLRHVFEGYILYYYQNKDIQAFWAMREGLLAWMVIVPNFDEGAIRSFWSDLWLGLRTREQSTLQGWEK